MTAPSIDMIAKSLRNCSLDGRRGQAAPPPPTRQPQPARVVVDRAAERAVEVTVELNSEVALPYHWEQCLDMRTGEVYYINWKNGTRTTEDPRTSSMASPTSSYSDEDEDEDDDDDEESSDGSSSGDGVAAAADDEDSSGESSGVSSLSPPSPGESTSGGGGQTLVAAGCRSCFMYFMVPKRVTTCPKCAGFLLHLGRNGCL